MGNLQGIRYHILSKKSFEIQNFKYLSFAPEKSNCPPKYEKGGALKSIGKMFNFDLNRFMWGIKLG